MTPKRLAVPDHLLVHGRFFKRLPCASGAEALRADRENGEITRACEPCSITRTIGSYMSHNTLIHRVVRPAVRIAARTGLTPNQVTTIRLATGLAASVIFAQGTRGWMVLGGIVFFFSMLLDRADGEMARQTGQMTLTGHRYDLAADGIASVASFAGLGIGLAYTGGRSAFWLGALAALGVGALFFELNVLKVVSVCGYNLFGGRITVDPDDAMIFVPILIWCNLTLPMVIVAAVISPCAVVGVGLFGFLRGRAGASAPTRNYLGKASP
jgi:archaetidylinositol phosphate synthase